MLPVTIARRAAEPQNDHIRPVAADHPHHVAQDAVVPPLPHGLLGGLGEPEIDGAGEELFGAIDLPRRQQFLRAGHPKLCALFGADQILPALAARQGEIGRAHVPAAREIGENPGALVVGMGGDDEHAAQLVQLAQRLLDIGSAGERLLLRHRGEDTGGQQEDEEAAGRH